MRGLRRHRLDLLLIFGDDRIDVAQICICRREIIPDDRLNRCFEFLDLRILTFNVLRICSELYLEFIQLDLGFGKIARKGRQHGVICLTDQIRIQHALGGMQFAVQLLQRLFLQRNGRALRLVLR